MDHAPASTNAERKIATTAFWTCTGAGVLAMAVAWLWLGLSIVEEASEQGKAEAAGTSMAGFAATVGGTPLAIAHLLGFALLSRIAWRIRHDPGLAYALLGCVAASLAGLGVAQLLLWGQLFSAEPAYVP
ncbi:hypothetical protein [Leucobacter luti]|uniref:hypothetical protein n=1 Tax=Leucobacter luti TaxID=340320 RepID=UPI003D07078C